MIRQTRGKSQSQVYHAESPLRDNRKWFSALKASTLPRLFGVGDILGFGGWAG
jgi:hypothetical protein